MTNDNIIAMLREGHSMRIDPRAEADLLMMALAAAESGATLTIAGEMSAEVMFNVARAGAGRVVWDIAPQ